MAFPQWALWDPVTPVCPGEVTARQLIGLYVHGPVPTRAVLSGLCGFSRIRHVPRSSFP